MQYGIRSEDESDDDKSKESNESGNDYNVFFCFLF